jgi:hypothetical protein
MAKRLTVEQMVANLKAIQNEEQALVDKLAAILVETEASLLLAKAKLEKMTDAIDALEGRPTLSKRLEEALAAQTASKPLVVQQMENTTVTGSESDAKSDWMKELPPAEPGMKWVLNTDLIPPVPVLVPINSQKELAIPGVTQVIAHALPPIAENAGFEPIGTNPEDLY